MTTTKSHDTRRYETSYCNPDGPHRRWALEPRLVAWQKPWTIRRCITIISLVDDYVDFPWNTMSVAYGPWVELCARGCITCSTAHSTRATASEVTTRAAYPLVRRQIAAAFAPDWPDIVISVHPLQTVIPLRVLRELGNPAPFITVVTDPVTPPLYWFCSGDGSDQSSPPNQRAILRSLAGCHPNAFVCWGFRCARHSRRSGDGPSPPRAHWAWTPIVRSFC